jgi:hypothetical protein
MAGVGEEKRDFQEQRQAEQAVQPIGSAGGQRN